MCLIVVAYRESRGWPLVVAANRDEFHRRDTDPAHWWPEQGVLAGRDRRAGGTWFGAGEDGRFAAVTNFRDSSPQPVEGASRGSLPLAWLAAAGTEAFHAWLETEREKFPGFTLLYGDRDSLLCCSNRGETAVAALDPGIHAISNGPLNAPWPKTEWAKAAMAEIIGRRGAGGAPDPDALLEMLYDRRQPDDAELPDTGVGIARERFLAPMFIVGPEYGTRSSTVFALSGSGRAVFVERQYDAEGRARNTRRFDFVTRSGR